jgi:hypothetical protein
MFSNKVKKLKRKKQKLANLIFIKEVKRIILVINFLKYTILLNTKRKKKNLNFFFFEPLFNYLSQDKNSKILKIKFKIYRQKLMQLQM